MSSKNNGVNEAAKGVTSTVGNLLGGVVNTAGAVVGTAGRGVGSTVNNTTGTRVVGDSLVGVTDGVEQGTTAVGKGVENAGQWKTK